MPRYEYRCNKCEKQFEVEQKMSDDVFKIHDIVADPDFDNCLGDLVKVFSSVGIVWKGSGFYKTDTRSSASKAVSKSSTNTETKSENKNTETKTPETKTASSSTNDKKSSDKSNKS